MRVRVGADDDADAMMAGVKGMGWLYDISMEHN